MPAGSDDIAIRVNSNNPTFRLGLGKSTDAFIAEMEPRTKDLLLVAASVFCVDSLARRGAETRPNLGRGWRRDLRFVIPVSDAGFWSSVHDELAQALTFLTGDSFSFVFITRPRPEPEQALLLDMPRPSREENVILFSGGLDSLTGAFETLQSPNTNVLLVTHWSAQKVITKQTSLVRELRRRFPGRVRWVRVRGTLVGCKASETTQRSRSFLYAALGYAAASFVEATRVHFFENGVVSVNLPIDRQVVGTMATRTTHPLFLHRLERLLSRIAGQPITIDNPYARMTKTEVVERLRDHEGAALIAATTSCSSVRERTVEHPHCGCCSQCLDRRFAILAAGVAEHDPSERYEVELLLGRREDPQDRTMASDWYRHATQRLARMSMEEFAAAFMKEIADIVAACPSQPSGTVVSETFAMHRRHGRSVRSVMARALSDLAGRVLDRSVPPQSLLAIVLNSASDPERNETSFSPPPKRRFDRRTEIFPLRLVAVADGNRPILRILGLGRFKGAHLALVLNLRPHLEEDCAAGLAPEQHRYTAAGHLGVKETVWQHARRCRREFAKEYEVVTGSASPPDLVVQGERQRGYRLDPEARFVEDPGAKPAADR
jgi:7-cyano-7-deazaguanine synthase in queuosine biosynthesis